jgi:hypothetical protein
MQGYNELCGILPDKASGTFIMDSLSREFPGLSRIRQLLSSPTFPDDEEKTRVAYRLMMVSAASLISTMIYSLVWVIILPQFAGRLLLATVAMLLFGTVILCVQSGRVQTGRSLFLGGLWIVVTLASASSGGTRAPIYGVYALVIMSATIKYGHTPASLNIWWKNVPMPCAAPMNSLNLC